MKFWLVLFAAVITWLCVNVFCKPEPGNNDNAVVVTDDKKSCEGQCSNIPPTFSCEQQKGWGHCDKEWMKGFCCKTCNECGVNNDTKCGNRCIDVPPARGRETCEYYAQNGDCDAYWMEGSCCRSCENAEICVSRARRDSPFCRWINTKDGKKYECPYYRKLLVMR